ncbi:helix-turn-helix transcriptional regulator [Amylibacter marinus]|nr:YafY family protein [Amylibacter marinus]
MAKSDRLLQMMHLLRSIPAPVTAEVLAEGLEVSIRTVYRDIESLRAAGAVIDGEAGYGYSLTEDPALPPMMFSVDEVEALVLGLREVEQVGDPVLAQAAASVLAKVNAGLPQALQRTLEHSVLRAKSFLPRPEINIDVAAFRRATREERELEIDYVDAKGAITLRRIQPLAIIYADAKLVAVAMCLLRDDFRAFRLDRIVGFRETGQGFSPRRVAMLRAALAQFRGEVGGDSRPV